MHVLKMNAVAAAVVASVCAAFAARDDIAKYDKNMAVEGITVANGLKWIDGKHLPIEGRAFDNVDEWYDRLPSTVTTNVNRGVRSLKHHTSGMQFRFATDSRRLAFKWMPYTTSLSMDHMPSTGVSGIDVYRFDKDRGRWVYAGTGRIRDAAKGGELEIPWTPGTPCLVNLGFSGSGAMELEMSEHLAAIDASCYVLDCLWNMGMTKERDVPNRPGRNVDENYEPFIRNLRAKRPGVPIVMAERCDVFCRPQRSQDRFIRALYEKLVAEGWKNLVYLPKDAMYAGDLDGTVDGVHPNDLGMRSLADAFAPAVAKALGLGE